MTALTDDTEGAIPIAAVTADGFSAWAETLPAAQRRWLESTKYEAKPGRTALVPDETGRLALIVHGVDRAEPVWALAALPADLPPGLYRLGFDPEKLFGPHGASQLALGWALGAYRYDRYRRSERAPASLAWPATADRKTVTALADGIALARDLINTPTEEMGPQHLAEAATALAGRHEAEIDVTVGDALLERNYPMIHAVGRASSRAPRLIDLRWGDPAAPRLTLVGKGVCFDSGGLDLKPASAMKLMKKDMGGSATVLGLAHAIMASGLKLRLRVLVPAVENAVSGSAFRPLDVFRTRKGLTVEIGNTDAEGRLVLCDALAEASSESPALLIDMATLTGAARTALGPDLPALFANNDAAAIALVAAGQEEADPLWRMPLWKPYRKLLDSKVADINNASDSPFAGAITAALYLQEFVEPEIPWIHIDTFAWNPTARPGRPEGGEALALRALYRMLRQRFG
ncbi:MAG TPA: leucyl aminopeptidase family protein [Stellaceae bacterium]|nr:leucyl aminopeptidase family protein [Stellaceae bacterium]